MAKLIIRTVGVDGWLEGSVCDQPVCRVFVIEMNPPCQPPSAPASKATGFRLRRLRRWLVKLAMFFDEIPNDITKHCYYSLNCLP